MNSERRVRTALEVEGYEVIKQHTGGKPDFYCLRGEDRLFVEVKCGLDGLRINQIKKIAELNEQGHTTLIAVGSEQIEWYEIHIGIISQIEEIPKSKCVGERIDKKIEPIKETTFLGRKIKCEKCEYIWTTESTHISITCPSCLKKTKNEVGRE